MPESVVSDEDPWTNGLIPLDGQDRQFLSRLKGLGIRLEAKLNEVNDKAGKMIEDLKSLQIQKDQLVGRLTQMAETADLYLDGFDDKYGTGAANFEIDEATWSLKRSGG